MTCRTLPGLEPAGSSPHKGNMDFFFPHPSQSITSRSDLRHLRVAEIHQAIAHWQLCSTRDKKTYLLFWLCHFPSIEHAGTEEHEAIHERIVSTKLFFTLGFCIWQYSLNMRIVSVTWLEMNRDKSNHWLGEKFCMFFFSRCVDVWKLQNAVVCCHKFPFK